jgi:hypothetical protein
MSKQNSNNVSQGDDLSVRSLSSEDVSQAPRGYCCAKSANPADGKGRKLHLLQMLVLPFIPILALIVQTAVILNNIMIYRQEVMDIESQVRGASVIIRWERRESDVVLTFADIL